MLAGELGTVRPADAGFCHSNDGAWVGGAYPIAESGPHYLEREHSHDPDKWYASGYDANGAIRNEFEYMHDQFVDHSSADAIHPDMGSDWANSIKVDGLYNKYTYELGAVQGACSP
ncbi:hypothetical protein CYMTET_25728 [Cymbomonas tetramitiformis]|uniref:Uncharacterized protein n=1 Tax=Cymbomonas tetramitiformis TaxID=36881 RepID=A0AAE0FTZ8_9CHLO|nr:hypothetical protein CYMTET_25728 [Cymbomonas tetramitiformis]